MLTAAAVTVLGVLLPEPVNGEKGFDLGFRPARFPAQRRNCLQRVISEMSHIPGDREATTSLRNPKQTGKATSCVPAGMIGCAKRSGLHPRTSSCWNLLSSLSCRFHDRTTQKIPSKSPLDKSVCHNPDRAIWYGTPSEGLPDDFSGGFDGDGYLRRSPGWVRATLVA